jgi:hypothetical protein
MLPPRKTVVYPQILGFLPALRPAVPDGYREKLLPICSVNIATVPIGLLLKIVLLFKDDLLLSSHGHILNDRCKKSGM